MRLEFKKINSQTFQNFYDRYEEEKTFLQTVNFAQFREKLGEDIFLYGIFKEEELIGISLIQKIKTRLKTFLHCPHGALIKKNENSVWEYFLEQYKVLGKQNQCDFVRISPLLKPEKITLFEKQKFIPAPVHLINPEKTWVLDLTESEETLLKNMKKTTRYEIRRQEKCHIDVHFGNTLKDLDIFWNLHLETVKRQKFVPFPKKNTCIQLDVWGEDCLIFNGKIDTKFYSSAIIIFDKKAAYYHQGASIYSKAPVSYAVLWQAVLEAKKEDAPNLISGAFAINHKKNTLGSDSRNSKEDSAAKNEIFYIARIFR